MPTAYLHIILGAERGYGAVLGALYTLGRRVS
jgi:hypothetical protein